MNQPLVYAAAASALAVACYALPAEAATCTWTGATNASWKTGTNWSGTGCTGGSGPPTGSTLTFPSGASNLSTNNNTTANNTYTIVISGAGYTLAGNAIKLGGDLTDSSASGSTTISLSMTMTAARTITVTNAAETLTVSGVVGGNFALTKSGSGTLTLSGTNTYGRRQSRQASFRFLRIRISAKRPPLLRRGASPLTAGRWRRRLRTR